MLAYRGQLHVVEIKRPTERGRLTENERCVRDLLGLMGIPYNVISTIEEAAELIGASVQ